MSFYYAISSVSYYFFKLVLKGITEKVMSKSANQGNHYPSPTTSKKVLISSPNFTQKNISL